MVKMFQAVLMLKMDTQSQVGINFKHQDHGKQKLFHTLLILQLAGTHSATIPSIHTTIDKQKKIQLLEAILIPVGHQQLQVPELKNLIFFIVF